MLVTLAQGQLRVTHYKLVSAIRSFVNTLSSIVEFSVVECFETFRAPKRWNFACYLSTEVIEGLKKTKSYLFSAFVVTVCCIFFSNMTVEMKCIEKCGFVIM